MRIEESRLNIIQEFVQAKKDKAFQLTTIRKSGTHFLDKLLRMVKIPDRKIYPLLHIEKIDVEHLRSNVNYIISIRDPRDAVVSLANWLINDKAVQKHKQNHTHSEEEHQRLLKMTLHERINVAFDETFLKGYQNVLRAKEKLPGNVYVFKFEDFIGPQYGGASKREQLVTLQKIIKLCNRDLSIEEVRKATAQVEGGTPTFTKRKEKVGGWKSILNDEQIGMIKEHLNPFILKFGYETNPDWDVDFLKERNAAKIIQEEALPFADSVAENL